MNPEQHAKKVTSHSPGLMDFASGLLNSVLNLPNGQVKFFGEIQFTEELWASQNDPWASTRN